eukprot:9249243-Alexandrium_andersonii.AAC.1
MEARRRSEGHPDRAASRVGHAVEDHGSMAVRKKMSRVQVRALVQETLLGKVCEELARASPFVVRNHRCAQTQLRLEMPTGVCWQLAAASATICFRCAQHAATLRAFSVCGLLDRSSCPATDAGCAELGPALTVGQGGQRS